MSAEAEFQAFVGKLVGDMGAAFTGPLVVLGDRLGLFKAIAAIGPADADAIAGQTGTHSRFVKEWLAAQAAAGNVSCDETGRFWLSEHQKLGFSDEASPVFMPGAYEILSSMYFDMDAVTEAFRSGEGLGWNERNPCLFRGTERFFRPGYAANLVQSWLPALEGVVGKLERGATVADVGCGHGATTVLMAQAFPNSRFHGFDYHLPSIERARARAQEAGVADRIVFEQATAQAFPSPDSGYDLVTFFDCLHDMGDPVGAARHVHGALAADGTWMIVEPYAHDEMMQNLNPVGRVFYAASAMICTPASAAQEGACCLGAQAGEKRLREVVTEGGFGRFRRAAETPFNLVLEARG